MNEAKEREATLKQAEGIVVTDKVDHRPPLKHRERVIHFQGPCGRGGDISIRELNDGTVQVWLFNLLSPGAVMICPEANFCSTRGKRAAAKSN